MSRQGRAAAAVLSLLFTAAPAGAEVFVRWTQDGVPAREVLGISRLAILATHPAVARSAVAEGYQIYLEIEAAALDGFTPQSEGFAGLLVRGAVPDASLQLARERLRPMSVRVIPVDERGKWPHIRSNWVTKRNDVLQVAGRSAQPWIENNAALARIAEAPGARPLLTYTWKPIAVADADEGPALENYLVAIAEAGSFRADLLLPLSERFQQQLLLGHPEARRDWNDIRRYAAFYAGEYASRYEPMASIGVVTDSPMAWFEVLNLLARHNLPFVILAPSAVGASSVASLKLLLVLGTPDAAGTEPLAAFQRQGGLVHVVTSMPDPNKLALEMRRKLGTARRVLDVWNGITVIAAPYGAPDGTTVLVTLVNYAHQELPVQLRVPGTFSEVRFETPEQDAVLVPHELRNGSTEFVLPSVRIGARVFLTRRP